MSNEVILTPEEIKEFRVTTRVADTYKWLLDNVPDGKDADKVSEFAHAIASKKESMLDLWEFRAYIKKLSDNLELACKAAANVIPDDERPEFIALSKASKTYKFTADGSAQFVANKVIEMGFCGEDELFARLTVKNIADASGMKIEKVAELFPDDITFTESARVLKIK